MREYKIIDKTQVLEFMIKNSLTADFYEILHTSKFIAKQLKTSRYQSLKYLRELKNEGKILYKSVIYCQPDYETGDCYCENHLPVFGYIVNKKFLNV